MKDNRWTFRIPKEYPHIREETTKAAKDIGMDLFKYIAMALRHFNSAAGKQSEH